MQGGDIILVNIYAPNIGVPKYIKQILTDIKEETDGNTKTVGDFNTPLTSMDRSSRWKINKATEILNDTIEQLDLIHIFRTLHPKKAEYTFFSSAYGTFSRTDPILGHKTNLKIFKSIEIISSIFSDHNGVKLEINHRKRNKRKQLQRASLVAQWLRILLPMQGTRVRALVQEDPTCCGATKPVCHNC